MTRACQLQMKRKIPRNRLDMKSDARLMMPWDCEHELPGNSVVFEIDSRAWDDSLLSCFVCGVRYYNFFS